MRAVMHQVVLRGSGHAQHRCGGGSAVLLWTAGPPQAHAGSAAGTAHAGAGVTSNAAGSNAAADAVAACKAGVRAPQPAHPSQAGHSPYFHPSVLSRSASTALQLQSSWWHPPVGCHPSLPGLQALPPQLAEHLRRAAVGILPT